MSTRVSKEDLAVRLEKLNQSLCRIAKRLGNDYAELDLSWWNGGVQIVRSEGRERVSNRGTKREIYDTLEVMRKACDIANGY